jgi:hypothetical protein
MDFENNAIISLGPICADILIPTNQTERQVVLNIVLEQPYGLAGIITPPPLTVGSTGLFLLLFYQSN